jgi:hypothetical protein
MKENINLILVLTELRNWWESETVKTRLTDIMIELHRVLSGH